VLGLEVTADQRPGTAVRRSVDVFPERGEEMQSHASIGRGRIGLAAHSAVGTRAEASQLLQAANVVVRVKDESGGAAPNAEYWRELTRQSQDTSSSEYDQR
jgi:hypothetical protein